MNIALHDILDHAVYPTTIKNCEKTYITLFYYNSIDSAFLHTGKNIICFESYDVLKRFCAANALVIVGKNSVFDFDIPITNPVNYRTVLDNWNLLNTISNTRGMYFEGNDTKYTPVYKQLFRHCTSTAECPDAITYNDNTRQKILKVFKKKNRLLSDFIDYSPDKE